MYALTPHLPSPPASVPAQSKVLSKTRQWHYKRSSVVTSFIKPNYMLLFSWYFQGKGFPDVNTRMMVRRLWCTLQIPILALVDADPHGNVTITSKLQHTPSPTPWQAHRRPFEFLDTWLFNCPTFVLWSSGCISTMISIGDNSPTPNVKMSILVHILTIAPCICEIPHPENNPWYQSPNPMGTSTSQMPRMSSCMLMSPFDRLIAKLMSNSHIYPRKMLAFISVQSR